MRWTSSAAPVDVISSVRRRHSAELYRMRLRDQSVCPYADEKLLPVVGRDSHESATTAAATRRIAPERSRLKSLARRAPITRAAQEV
jgi:hypothetical protein